MRDLEATDKVRETDGSVMIIGEILCLFLLRKLHILLAPFSFSPLCGLVTHNSMNQAKRDAKDGIFRHNNKKYLGITNSVIPKQGPTELDIKV